MGTFASSKTPRATGCGGMHNSAGGGKAAGTLPHSSAASGRQAHNGSTGGSAPAAPSETAAQQRQAAGMRTQQTPRGLGSTATACAALGTPRSMANSIVSAAGPGTAPAAAAAATAKKNDHERAEEVRQQLRLLRMQNLQLRHLKARVEAAVQAKKAQVRQKRMLHACVMLVHGHHMQLNVAELCLHQSSCTTSGAVLGLPCCCVGCWSSNDLALLCCMAG